MKRLSLFTSVLALVGLGFAFQSTPVQAETTTRLLRSPQDSAVYYTVSDGRRFAFPNQAIYASWYASFNQVEMVPVETLSQSRLAGVVLYKPGSLVKIVSDPKVYLVMPNGELRWVETEAVMRQLIGDTWAQQVHDLDDGFFFAYHIGASIPNTNTLSLPNILADVHAQSILANQELAVVPTTTTIPTTPTVPTTPTSTPATVANIVLQTSLPDGIRFGETLRISIFAERTIPKSIIILVNGAPAQTCLQQATCSTTVTHQLSSRATAYRIDADATYEDGSHKTQTVTIPVIDAAAGALRLTTSVQQSKPQGNVDLRSVWSDSVAYPYRISLFVNGGEQKVCYDALECNLSYGVDAPVGTTLAVTAVAEDRSGNFWRTATSSIAIVANPSPIVITGMNGPTIYTGETATITAQANDDDGIAFIEIWQDGTRVMRCERPTCAYTSAPFTQSGTIHFRVIAEDLRGIRQETDLRPMLVVSAANS